MTPATLLSCLAALALAWPACALAEGEPAALNPPTAAIGAVYEAMEVSMLRISATSRCGSGCVVRDLPYSAERVTESVQVLADGNRITTQRTEKVMRDALGRTRTETEWLGKPLVQIQDPVARISYRLYPATQTGLQMSMGEPPAAPAPAAFALPNPGQPVSAGASRVAEQLGPVLAGAPAAHTAPHKLGTRQMEGLNVEGSLTTRTTPAGAAGNAQPLVSTTEVWTSPELKLTLYTKSIDPRYGERITRLTRLRRDEAPASSFAPPAGYTMHDIPRP